MSDMKCPFCQQEMRRTNGTHNKIGVWQCQNSNDPDNVCIASGYLFNDDVLNYIDRTRKALDVAVDALTRCQNNTPDNYTATQAVFLLAQNSVFIDKALEQITALEQKD